MISLTARRRWRQRRQITMSVDALRNLGCSEALIGELATECLGLTLSEAAAMMAEAVRDFCDLVVMGAVTP